MKKIVLTFSPFLYTILFLQAFVFAQENQSAEWIRVQSDNGEFSVEVPAKYDFIVDDNGFSISKYPNDYPLTEAKIFNSYQEKTLVTFEIYKANKKVLDIIRDDDKRDGKSSEIQNGIFKLKQVLLKTDDYYAVRQYFSSANYIYILTAASRNGETSAMKRFFNSLIFNPSAKNNGIPNTVLISALNIIPLTVEANPSPTGKLENPIVPPPLSPKDENSLPVVIIIKPRASFTDTARKKLEDGIISMRLGFSENGGISKVELLRTLGSGLVRQAVFAAFRIKFLPAEKEGKAKVNTKVVEYSFSIY